MLRANKQGQQPIFSHNREHTRTSLVRSDKTQETPRGRCDERKEGSTSGSDLFKHGRCLSVQSKPIKNTTPCVHVAGCSGQCKDDDCGADDGDESVGCKAVGGWWGGKVRME
jgi:hypothetical protein